MEQDLEIVAMNIKDVKRKDLLEGGGRIEDFPAPVISKHCRSVHFKIKTRKKIIN